MENYICLNGCKTELSAAQMRELGLMFPKTINDYSIAEISAIVKRGAAREHFKVHDTIQVRDCLKAQEYALEIIGFDHDVDNDNPSSPTITVMAKTLLDARRMHGGACARGWIDTELREWLNTEAIERLPDELTSYIRRTVRKTHSADGQVFETVDRLFIPSESEMFGSAIYSDYEDGARYEAFATSENRIRFDKAGDADWFWTRSAYGGNSTNCCLVLNNGLADCTIATYASIRAPLCFSL